MLLAEGGQTAVKAQKTANNPKKTGLKGPPQTKKGNNPRRGFSKLFSDAAKRVGKGAAKSLGVSSLVKQGENRVRLRSRLVAKTTLPEIVLKTELKVLPFAGDGGNTSKENLPNSQIKVASSRSLRSDKPGDLEPLPLATLTAGKLIPTDGIQAKPADVSEQQSELHSGKAGTDIKSSKTKDWVIAVADRRTAQTPKDAGTEIAAASQETHGSSTEAENPESPVKVVQVDLGGKIIERRDGAPPTTSTPAFQKMLSENMNTQIVKQSGIILRDNDQGEIRLVLRPEHLGKVRVRLQLNENQINGRIIVENAFVKEAFDQTLEDLYRAFRNSGFEAGALEVFVDGKQKEQQFAEAEPKQPYYSGVKELEDAVLSQVIDTRTEGIVNLVV